MTYGIILSHSSFPDPNGTQDSLGRAGSCLHCNICQDLWVTISALGILSESQKEISVPLATDIWIPDGKYIFWNQRGLQEFKETARSRFLEVSEKSL